MSASPASFVDQQVVSSLSLSLFVHLQFLQKITQFRVPNRKINNKKPTFFFEFVGSWRCRSRPLEHGEPDYQAWRRSSPGLYAYMYYLCVYIYICSRAKYNFFKIFFHRSLIL